MFPPKFEKLRFSTMANKPLLLALVLLVAFVFTGCEGKQDSSSSPDTRPSKLHLKLGIQKVLANYPVVLAREKGLFASADIEIELVQFQSANDALDALLAGRIFSDAVIPFQMLFGVEVRSPGAIRCFGAMIASPEKPLEIFVVRADSKIETEEQLSKAKIGVFPGTFALSLTKLALGPKVSIQQIPLNAQAEALARGEVDALVAYDPMATHLIQDAKGKLFAKGLWEKKLGTFAVGGYCVTKSTLEKRREAVRQLQQVLSKAIEFYQADPNAALATLTPEFSLRPELRKHYSVAKSMFGKDLSPDLLRSTYEVYRRAGIVSGELEPSRLLLNDL